MMKGFRTYLVSAAILLLGILQNSQLMTDLMAQLHIDGNGTVTIVIAAITAGLRTITTTPPGQKTPVVAPVQPLS